MSDYNKQTADTIYWCMVNTFCERGKFYPDKNFGSRIFETLTNKRLMLSYIKMALSKIDGVYVKDMTYVPIENLITINVLINNEERQVYVTI